MRRTALVLPAILFVLMVCSQTNAQTYTESNADGLVAPGIAAGNPASSYALTGIDHVNMYNGNLNISIPLLQIGGRGTAGYTVTYSVDTQWTVQKQYNNGYASFVPVYGSSAPFPFSPGALIMRRASAQPNSCLNNTNPNNQFWIDSGPYVTHMVWTAADGTETALLDSTYGGQPQGSTTTCQQIIQYQPVDRGRTFTSPDGSDMTFVASADVYDSIIQGDGYQPGTLYFRDGTKYTINNSGEVTQIEDRNGNLIQLSYYPSNGVLLKITDALSRTITVTYNTPATIYTIAYPSFNGATQHITISYTSSLNVLGPSQSPETLHCLFPELNGSSSTNYGAWVVSSITLADGSSYSFQYNSYGEPMRLTLPTGGIYQYIIPGAKACASNSGSGVMTITQYTQYSIHRPITERDEYSDGSTLSAVTTFTTKPQSSGLDPNHSARPGTISNASYKDGSGALQRFESHYFYGDPTSATSIPVHPTDYSPWYEGIDFQDAIGNTAGPWLTQNFKLWDQRPCAQGENCWFGNPQLDSAPAHDPQLCQVKTTPDSGPTSGMIFLYDRYNNQTAQYEYDYNSAPAIGAARPSAATGFTRQTPAAFSTGSAYLAPNRASAESAHRHRGRRRERDYILEPAVVL
jgi:hypothetical protein